MSRREHFFHGTNEHWAAQIVNQGQRANMSPLGALGRGLYLSHDLDEAHQYASGRNNDPAVIEGTLRPDARVYDLTQSDLDQLDTLWAENAPKKDGSYRRAKNKWNARMRQGGYDVLRNPSTGFHTAISVGAFVPSRVHYPDGQVDLR